MKISRNIYQGVTDSSGVARRGICYSTAGSGATSTIISTGFWKLDSSTGICEYSISSLWGAKPPGFSSMLHTSNRFQQGVMISPTFPINFEKHSLMLQYNFENSTMLSLNLIYKLPQFIYSCYACGRTL